ncbi:hypothetical protein [Streptomyces tsukubensis]|uniref:hypothetical protein n=1 Tax=Streptomyces tsukubensis TaxID=83656 RepID=UPI00344E869F
MYRFIAVIPLAGALSLLGAPQLLPVEPALSLLLLPGAAILGMIGFSRLLRPGTPGDTAAITAFVMFGSWAVFWVASGAPGAV